MLNANRIASLIAEGVLLAFLGGALSGCASAAEDGDASKDRASTPPGTSRDDIPLSGGALIGGSIDRSVKQKREIRRCEDLTGTLRVQCLRDARDQPIVPQP